MSGEKRETAAQIVLFDGICHLCNGFVAWVIRYDSKHCFKFAPLQGETASLLGLDQSQEPQTVMVFQDGRFLQKSEAVIWILAKLPAWRWLAPVLKLVPKTLADFVYDLVAKHRYSLFGKLDSCPIPSAEERLYLLP